MAGKMFLVLLGLAVVVAMIDARPKRDAFKLMGAKAIVKRQDVTREEFVEFLRQLTVEDIEAMSEDDKIGLLFLIYLFEIEPEELEKREAIVKRFAKRDSDDFSREDFIHYLRTLTEEDVEAMSDDEKIGLLFLIYLFEVQPEELEKREAITKRLAKRDSEEFSREDFIQYLRTLTEEDVEKMTDEEKIGLLFLIYLFEVQPEELEKREAIVKRFAKRELKSLNRDEFLQILQTLTEDDFAKMTNEQKIKLLSLVYYYRVQPEELGNRGSGKFSRDEFLQIARTLTEDDFAKMTVDQKINLLFLVYYFGVQTEELGNVDPEKVNQLILHSK